MMDFIIFDGFERIYHKKKINLCTICTDSTQIYLLKVSFWGMVISSFFINFDEKWWNPISAQTSLWQWSSRWMSWQLDLGQIDQMVDLVDFHQKWWFWYFCNLIPIGGVHSPQEISCTKYHFRIWWFPWNRHFTTRHASTAFSEVASLT